jgi:hypothetical protein
MYFRVLAFVVSLMLLASSVMASAPAIAAPDQHPLAVLAAADQASGDLPVGESTGHDQIESLLDVPDQLAGPCAPHNAALRTYRVAPHLAASMTHPDLEGPQRPPRATGLAA